MIMAANTPMSFGYGFRSRPAETNVPVFVGGISGNSRNLSQDAERGDNDHPTQHYIACLLFQQHGA
jgi:hypothetical protein